MSSQTSNNPSGFRMLILLLIIVGAAALMISPVSADTGVTIAAQGDQSYYLGEKVVFSGHNYDSDSTYLFLTGPNLQATGGKLTSPDKAVVSGNPDSFTVVKTKPDKTWEYALYTANLPLDAGTYTVYAVSQPKAKDQVAPDAAHVGIALKKPFINAEISPSSVSKGQPFTVRGIAEGIPPAVHIWIIGDNYVFNATTPVNPDASFTFTGDTQLSGKLPEGQCYLIVQHPMADNQSDFAISGDYVRNLKLNNGTNVFRLTGPGSLQGSDAADALTAAISEQEANDRTLTKDTYTIVPFQVTAAGPVSGASAGTGITISAQGDQSYYWGEEVVFSGVNNDSDSTYLFMTGPNLPNGGGKLSSPQQKPVSGDPGSFTMVKTKPDNTWEFTLYTSEVMLDAGMYTIYAVSKPETKDQLGPDAANVSIILKKPFITAEISPSSVSKGQPFTVRGTAEGDPPAVQIWIIGDNFVFNTTTPVNPDASFTFNGNTQLSGKLPKGQCYLIVQHAMQNNTFDIVLSGDYVRALQGNNGMILFKINGAGSLQGSDAAEALIAALSDPQNGDDTFTVIPFIVYDTGTSVPQTQPITTTPVPNQTQHAPLQYAPFEAIVLILGIAVWNRR